MKSRGLAIAIAVLLAGIAVPASATGEPPTPRSGDTRPPLAGTLLSAERVPTGPAYPKGTTAHRTVYVSSSPAGLPTIVSGLTLVPPGRAPAGGWPVVAWGHGTTGIGDACAPSARRGAGAYYPEDLAQYVRNGYAVAATDYPGLGSPGVHPYLVAESEARAMIDSVTAARRVTPGLSARWVAAGHSQGGQAAMATAEIADDYSAGLSFGGAVVYAPAPNSSDTVDDTGEIDPLTQTFYAMTLVGLKTQHPELNYADYLGRRARALLPAVRSECLPELPERFVEAGLSTGEFDIRDAAARERLRGWLAENEIGKRRADGPVLVVQGTADQVVFRELTDRMVAESRGHGSTVDYRVYSGADHATVLPAAAPAVFDWLAAHTRR